jgi:hypothetical protein
MRSTIMAGLVFALSASAASAQTYPPSPSPSPSAPTTAPRQGTPPQQGGPPRFGLRCQTPQLSCNLPQPGRVGLTCICNSPLGRFSGFVVQ